MNKSIGVVLSSPLSRGSRNATTNKGGRRALSSKLWAAIFKNYSCGATLVLLVLPIVLAVSIHDEVLPWMRDLWAAFALPHVLVLSPRPSCRTLCRAQRRLRTW